MPVKPIPDDYTSVTPYLVIPDVKAEIEFLKTAFGAELEHCHPRPDESVGHAEVRIRGAAIMMGQSSEQFPPMPGMVYLYTENTDADYQRALDAGAESVMEPADMFYGARNAGVKDSNGNVWWIATQIEEFSDEEILRRGENPENWRSGG